MFETRFDTPDRAYTFYYDESNNHRKFYINADHDSYNIDNDPARKQAAATNFMLGGIVHVGETCDADPGELITNLRLQKSAKELKFAQIASGSFDSVLKSPRIRQVLQWLLDSDLFVHYFSLNMEYWAFVDIVDDCISHCLQHGRLAIPGERLFSFVASQKDALQRLVAGNRKEFLATMRQFSYPSIGDREREFVAALLELTRRRIASLTSYGQSILEEISVLRGLEKLLFICRDIDEMGLVDDDEEGVLVDGLSEFYQFRGRLFPNSLHVFDEELSVEKELIQLDSLDPDVKFRHRFVNSETSPFNQVSDVIAGLLAKYFEFIGSTPLDALLGAQAAFNPFQIEALGLLKAVIEKSHEENAHLLHYVMPASDHRKHGVFLFPNEYGR
jgi:hypothetical protein